MTIYYCKSEEKLLCSPDYTHITFYTEFSDIMHYWDWSRQRFIEDLFAKERTLLPLLDCTVLNSKNNRGIYSYLKNEFYEDVLK